MHRCALHDAIHSIVTPDYVIQTPKADGSS